MEHVFRFRQGESEFEFRGERDYVEQQIRRWQDQMGQPTGDLPDPGLDGPGGRPIAVRKNIDFGAFLNLKQPESNLDRLLTLAYFMEKYEGQPRYNLGDLNRAWHEAYPEEGLTPDIWQEGLAQNYLEEREGYLTLSFSGEAYVQNGLTDQYR